MSKHVAHESDNHKATRPQRQMTHHLRGGTARMRQAGEVYLPRMERENHTVYENRLYRSVLLNIYGKTVEMFAGRIWKYPPKIKDDTPEEIREIANEDFDGCGLDIASTMQQATEGAVDDGVVYLFVESPQFVPHVDDEGNPVSRLRSVAEDRALGLRPFVKIIRASSMLGVRYDDQGNVRQFRYHYTEEVDAPDDPDGFLTKEEELVRVVDIGAETGGRVRHRLYRKQKRDRSREEHWVMIQEIITDFEQIALVPFYARKVRRDVGMPLFVDLAYLNVRHWQSASDQANITHTIRVPILAARGMKDPATEEVQEVVIGPNHVVHLEPGGDLSYVEHSGKAAEIGMKEVEQLTTDMLRMGTEILLNKPTGSQTATARALDQAQADTLMVSMATRAEAAIAEVFRHMAVALGLQVEDAGGIDLSKDYDIAALDAQLVAQLVGLWERSGISHRTLVSEMQRYGLLSEDVDYEQELSLIEEDRSAAIEREMRMALELGADREDAEDEDRGNRETD